MGVFSKLFGRRKQAPVALRHKVEVEETSESDEDGETEFDPDATIFISPKIPIIGQQAMRKLREYEQNRVTRYNWLCGPDCLGVCRRVQEEGPYSVADGLAGIAPVPGMGAYRECACTVSPVTK
ncbi:MAG: hypothetical protein QNJ87_07880 [Gammaproteobacteria bacterium]|nr:hypothetical protein [Gammaproteobacteria bacterium]MDJ0871673.1 hypothetical protein [Gammaproteobacteria bacterium]MDJ0891220.1 hypothetical protein [Gammaproteobacteria bacterium]